MADLAGTLDPDPQNAIGSPRRVVYTCMFGHSEPFNDYAYDAPDVDFICFTDDPTLTSEFWQIKVLPRSLLDAPRRSKQIKALPHRFLPDYDWSLYIDNTVQLLMPPAEIFDRYLAPASMPMVCFRHPWRNCVYDEAEAVIEAGYDDPVRVRAQMAYYRSLGYPAGHGLTKSTFILRRHRDPRLQDMLTIWHEQVLRHSLRDQLSVDPAAWWTGFAIDHMPEDFTDFRILTWPNVKDGLRVPRDFDDALYLQLNPDITGDARKHYLQLGAAEGRLYK